MTIRTQSGLRIDAEEFGALFRELETKNKDIALAIKKRLRNEAKPLVTAMQKAVTDPTSKRSARITQIRTKQRTGERVEVRTNTSALVAKGIGFRMGTGKSPFVRFSASGSKLPSGRRAMAKALNKKSFRHPVFGDRSAPWVEQAGRPYFGAVILDERERLLEAINKAMDDVAEKVGRSRIRG